VSATDGSAATDRTANETENKHDFRNLDAVEALTLRNLGARAEHPDLIANRAGLSAREVQRALMTLLLEGLVEAQPGGRFRKRDPRL
jgi:predicted Rossmann fold nucleotide-binding protein DprA/Smf involved in DNA uptake